MIQQKDKTETEQTQKIAEAISQFPSDIQNRIYGVIIGMKMAIGCQDEENK